jgi:hypothetical protein
MTIGELKKKIENIDDDLAVFVPCSTGEHEYNLAHSANGKHLLLNDQQEEETIVFVIDEL